MGALRGPAGGLWAARGVPLQARGGQNLARTVWRWSLGLLGATVLALRALLLAWLWAPVGSGITLRTFFGPCWLVGGLSNMYKHHK